MAVDRPVPQCLASQCRLACRPVAVTNLRKWSSAAGLAVAGSSEPDRPSLRLREHNPFELPGGLGPFRPVAPCPPQKMVKVPYSKPAESSRPADQQDDRLASDECGGVPVLFVSSGIVRSASLDEPSTRRRSGMARS